MAVNISCVAVIMFIGIIGNALVFRVYARRPLTPQKTMFGIYRRFGLIRDSNFRATNSFHSFIYEAQNK